MLKEQIAELFLQYRQDLCDTEFAPLPFEQYTIPDLHKLYTEKVLALFPQGDKDGLLSEKEICKMLGCVEDEYYECRSKNLDGVVPDENDYNEIMAVEACGDFQYAVDIVNAQHALDNQSKQAVLKEQMERVIEKIDAGIEKRIALNQPPLLEDTDPIMKTLYNLKAELEGENEGD